MYTKLFRIFLSLPFVGRLFDKNGNFKDWWSYESELNFKDRSQCLADQYSDYEVFGEYVSIWRNNFRGKDFLIEVSCVVKIVKLIPNKSCNKAKNKKNF